LISEGLMRRFSLRLLIFGLSQQVKWSPSHPPDTFRDTLIQSRAVPTSCCDRRDAPYTYPKTNTMNTRSFLFSLMLVAVSGVQAQSLSADAGSLSARPLNLSQRPAKVLSDAALVLPEQAVQATDPAPEQVPMPLPYGTGFETRQQGSTSDSSAGSKGGSGGSGGGGRGGSGRGR
jgi:uncharacterized membrane protein YgcG